MSLAPEDQAPEVNVGVLLVLVSGAEADRIAAFARRIVEDIRSELEPVTGQRWVFDLTDPIHLPNDDARRPAPTRPPSPSTCWTTSSVWTTRWGREA